MTWYKEDQDIEKVKLSSETAIARTVTIGKATATTNRKRHVFICFIRFPNGAGSVEPEMFPRTITAYVMLMHVQYFKRATPCRSL